MVLLYYVIVYSQIIGHLVIRQKLEPMAEGRTTVRHVRVV